MKLQQQSLIFSNYSAECQNETARKNEGKNYDIKKSECLLFVKSLNHHAVDFKNILACIYLNILKTYM